MANLQFCRPPFIFCKNRNGDLLGNFRSPPKKNKVTNPLWPGISPHFCGAFWGFEVGGCASLTCRGPTPQMNGSEKRDASSELEQLGRRRTRRRDGRNKEMSPVLLFMVYIGDEIHKLHGNYFINHEISIPSFNNHSAICLLFFHSYMLRFGLLGRIFGVQIPPNPRCLEAWGWGIEDVKP